MSEARYYAVSSGNGNDGVSHLFPDYIVKTDRPWALARLAALSTFKKGEGQAWCEENLELDGESDYTIYATLRESPETQNERNEMNDRYDALKDEYDSRGSDNAHDDDARCAELESEMETLQEEIDSFGCDYAWNIFEVFPWDESNTSRPIYESLEDAFGEDCALVKEETE